jgi:CDP-6-deoxy-D-xylo-4-hexulose-3-dehydrase
MPKPRWPLAISPFTFLDKLRIGWFLLTEPMWTYGAWVKRYEDLWVKQMGVKHAVMVSSGSTANELIALRRKWELEQSGQWPQRNKVVFPVNTWISSVSVWVHLGFEPVFVDVDPGNLNVTAAALGEAFATHGRVSVSPAAPEGVSTIGTVFYTALLGYFNDIELCKALTEHHGARFLMDNCEASFSYRGAGEGAESILSLTTCSTSVFFSHLTTSGTEGGFVFTDNEDEANWYRMMRSHGLTRGMPERYRNPKVAPEFDFYLLGSNYRSSNLQAYMGTLDFTRAYQYSMTDRRATFDAFNDTLDTCKYRRFQTDVGGGIGVPLALPILCRDREQRLKVEAYLKAQGVLTRPLIAGCLLAHTAFAGYGDIDDYPVAKWSHDSAIYIGLHSEVTADMARALAEELNAL